MKKLVILGSTGSIGTQTLEVVRMFPGKFQVVGLSCGSNVELLRSQIEEFRPRVVCIASELKAKGGQVDVPQGFQGDTYGTADGTLREAALQGIKVLQGMEGLCSLAAFAEADLIVNALVGSIGVQPTLAAIDAGKNIALANKETLVCEGERIMMAARFHNVQVLPVDSEHSAIFQCLSGRAIEDVEKIVLTCSGGPFRGFSREQLKNVTKEEALKHPTWKMGAKISVDSATLVNKGLEVIEAMHLFHLRPEQIEVVIHPQSQVHGIVYFKDGTVLLQAAANDMRIPISYALHYPERVANQLGRLELVRREEKNIAEPGNVFSSAATTSSQLPERGTLEQERLPDHFLEKFDAERLPGGLSVVSSANFWTFEKPDMETFEGLKIAYEAARKGGDFPKIFNEENEKAVAAFLRGEIGFLDIYARLRSAMVAASLSLKEA